MDKADQPGVRTQIMDLAAELYPDRDTAEKWARTPQVLFDGRSAEELIAIGAGRRVINFLRSILDGAYL